MVFLPGTKMIVRGKRQRSMGSWSSEGLLETRRPLVRPFSIYNTAWFFERRRAARKAVEGRRESGNHETLHAT